MSHTCSILLRVSFFIRVVMYDKRRPKSICLTQCDTAQGGSVTAATFSSRHTWVGGLPGSRLLVAPPSTHPRTNNPPVDMAEAGSAPPDATVGVLSRQDLRGTAPCSPGHVLGDVEGATEPLRLIWAAFSRSFGSRLGVAASRLYLVYFEVCDGKDV